MCNTNTGQLEVDMISIMNLTFRLVQAIMLAITVLSDLSYNDQSTKLVKNYHRVCTTYQLPGSLLLYYSLKFYIFPHQHSVQNFVVRKAWPPL